MADPMLTIGANDDGPTWRAKANENARRRFVLDERIVPDASTTQLATDELITTSATSAARTLNLLPLATANAVLVDLTAAGATFTYTIDPNASESVDGASTKVFTAAKRFWLIPKSTGWITLVFA